ncbi:hypothetical protein YDYSY3_02740 [Paenibacillus chitinolyticus]|uniref:hypothetical protein n=1 Tax=Paenibacillus chitinolyticus TaxID=79263 RepID=UPI0026E4BB82|nr:hypothetical protein [Paenibacillus chitinolyticus]GKS09274.1 hypothetical protein YDYSY3_02740 [Paenibacillus chitinolyticus]
MSRNQFFYLYGLATQTVCADENHCRNATEHEKYNYFTNDNVEWAKQQLIYELDVNEISKRLNEQIIGAVGTVGASKVAYEISEEAIKAILKKWGKTDGKKALDAFTKAADRGFVDGVGANGLKNVSSRADGRTTEIKILNKGWGEFRIFGKYVEEKGKYIFDLFDKGMH